MVRRLIPIAVVLLLGTAHADETIRCGRWVVDSSATVEELVSKCGEPTAKDSVVQDVRARNTDGTTRVVGTTVTEFWTYERGSGALPIVVTIVDGRIRSIEHAP